MKRIILTAVAAATAIAAFAAPAAASAATTPAAGRTYHAATYLSGRPEGGGNGTWATDNFTRHAAVQYLGQAPLTDCGTSSGSCFAYYAWMNDVGHFTTTPGAFAPNQGAPHTGETIGPAVTGRMSGYGKFGEFYATALPQPRLVPPAVPGSADPSYLWPQLFFPQGTTFTGVNEQAYRYSYHAGSQSWVDADYNSDGQIPEAGQITR